jgi:hypothetical protein
MASWFGEVSYIIVVMTHSSQVKVGDVDRSIPESTHRLEWYSSNPQTQINWRSMRRASNIGRGGISYTTRKMIYCNTLDQLLVSAGNNSRY